MTLKELRKEKGLTQAACAKVVGVPVRTYVRYETDEGRAGTLKYRYMLETLQKYGVIDEEHGLLTVDKIKSVCAPLFEQYGVKYAYLFGSYAKGKATERSDSSPCRSTGCAFMSSSKCCASRSKRKSIFWMRHSWKTTACSSKKSYGTG